MKVRAPSYINLQALAVLARGCYLADVIAIIGSLDPVIAEVDK
jgi:NADH-quinone oxidoreductase subunit D